MNSDIFLGSGDGSYDKGIRMVYESLSLLWAWPGEVLEGRTGIFGYGRFVCVPA